MSGYDMVAFDRALARAGDGVFVVGSEGRVQLWSSAAEKIRLCSPRRRRVLTLLKMGEPAQEFDVRTRPKPGRSFWLPCPA